MTIRRAFFAALSTVWAALAGPPLTTIQDVLYKADGTRFSGTAVITWSSFEAPDLSNITTQNVTVKIADGNLRVQLVPTTGASPSAYYTVRYNSDGKVQFAETWAVPSSMRPLRVRDVRIPAHAGVANDTAPSPVQESDIIGLVADLGARPVKGPGYAPGRVAVVNAQGAVESVAGSPGDCVRVDGTSGPCGSSTPGFVDSETPAGAVDGANTAFTLAAVPDPAASLAVYRNGILVKAGFDYTASGSTLQFVPAAAPQQGDTLLVSYRLGGQDVLPPQMYPAPQVLCSGTGAATNATSPASIGTCTIQPGALMAGDRVQILFDFAHQGAASGFTVEVHWGATTILQRSAAAAETLLSGRADAAVHASGAQVTAEGWSTSGSTGPVLTDAADALDTGLTIGFYAQTGGGDTVTLRNFTVVRMP